MSDTESMNASMASSRLEFIAPAGMMSVTDVYSVVAERLFSGDQVSTE